MKTIVINLLGGSGLGKSTTAALLFGELKNQGKCTELVREYIKEWAWQGREVGPFGQSITYGQQLDRESSLYNKVEFIVTDSPLILYPVYQHHYSGHDAIKHSILQDLKMAKKMDVTHVYFLLTRNKPFDARGRWETEEAAKKIDRKVKSFLVYHDINYILVDCPDQDRVQFIVDKIMKVKSKIGV